MAGQDASGRLEAQRDAQHHVPAELDAGDVATERHVVRQLVQFAADGERFTLPRAQGQPVVARHHRIRDHERLVEERLENGHPGTGDRGGGARVAGVGGAALGVRLRAQVTAVPRVQRRQRRGVGELGVHRILGRSGQVVVHPPGRLLRPQPPVHQPLVVPGGLHRVAGHPGHHVQHVGGAEGGQPGLGTTAPVGIAFGEHLPAVLGGVFEQDERGDHRALVGEVVVRPLGQIAAVTDVPRLRVEPRPGAGRTPVLRVQPVLVPGQVVVVRHGGAEALLHRGTAEGVGLHQELRDVRPRGHAGEVGAEHAARIHLLVVREPAQVGDGRRGDRLLAVPAERHVAAQRQPVALGHLSGEPLAGEHRRRRHRLRPPVQTFQPEPVRGLRVGQPGRAGHRHLLEVSRPGALQRPQQGPVRVRSHLAQLVVRQALGEAHHPRRVILLVAVGPLLGQIAGQRPPRRVGAQLQRPCVA